eukprot:Pgem_evm1s13907
MGFIKCECDDEILEFPLEEDNTLLLSTLQSQFDGVIKGLRYSYTESNENDFGNINNNDNNNNSNNNTVNEIEIENENYEGKESEINNAKKTSKVSKRAVVLQDGRFRSPDVGWFSVDVYEVVKKKE